MRVARLILAFMCACGAASRPPAKETALPQAKPAASHTAAARAWPVAHWVPRIAPASFADAKTVQGVRAEFYAPVRNNYGTPATAYLGGGRAGMIVSGGRAIWEGGKLGPVRDATMKLMTVMPIAQALGGGFVITGNDGVYFAQTFDGALVRLSGAPQAFRGKVGPHTVLSGAGLVSTSGQVVRYPVREIYAHQKLGFAVVIDETGTALHSSDGRTWKKLSTFEVHDAAEDGDTLVLFGPEQATVRVGADGKVSPAKLTDEERFALRMSSVVRPPLAEPFEGAFIDEAWQPSGRTNDEWFAVRGRDVLVANAPNLPQKKIAQTAEDGCVAITLERPLVACVTVGRRLGVYHLDFATGAMELEKAIEVKSGVANYSGLAPGDFPLTLFISSRCSGDASGFCVRDEQGGWREWPAIPSRGTVLPFPGEVVVLTDNAGAYEMRTPEALVRSIPAADFSKLSKELEHAASTGVLRTAAGIDMFYGPNPFEPITEAVSYVMHLPTDTRAPATISRVSGVVASAGTHALRLDQGKLYETSDGWTTWHEVPPPPSGALADLAGAMCSDVGCVVGPWARIGWSQP